MGGRMRVRSAREFDVNELVEILNSEEQTSSSSLPSPMRSPGAAKPRTDSRKEGIRTPPVTSWSRIDPEDAVVTNRERRAWGAHIGHSYSPPERDPPWMREHNGSSDEVKEQMEVLRSLTESDKLVQQLRAERRARKESRGRARRRRGESGWEEKQGRGQAQGGASRDVPLDPLPGASGRSDPLHWRDTGSVSELVTDDAFLQAIALEDSLLAEDAGAFPGSADLDYLNAFASEGDDCKGARQAGVQPAEGQLETEWQSLAALLERSLAGLGAGHGGDTPVAVGNWKQELAPRYKGTESSSRVEQSVQLVPLRQGQTIQQVDPPEKRPKERPQEEWGDGVAFAGPSGEVRAVSGVENDVEKNLKVSGAAFVGPASEWALGSEREETGGVEEKRVRSEQAGEASAGAKNGARNRESDVKAPMTPEERNSGGDTQQDLVSRLMQEVEEKTGEIQPLLTRVQALEAAVSEKDRAAASLGVQLEQQQAEHARVLQVLNAEFETETAALRDQAKAEAAAAIAVLESRVVVAERARQEGVAQGEEQERLLKEGRRREARLQETNKALLQRVKLQKAENEAIARHLETAQTAAKDSSALLESARREAKALRGRADELAGEREAEKAGGERAREAGARLRRELTEAKAAAKASEAAQVRCQAEGAALRKRLAEAESTAEQERAQRQSAQAECEECRLQVLQLSKELETLQTRLRGREADQSLKDTCRPAAGMQGLIRGSEQGLRGQESGAGRQRGGTESSLEPETDEDSVSFLTPSPDTSPDKQEKAGDWGLENPVAGKARPGHAGAPAARGISFAEPLESKERRAEIRVPGSGPGEAQMAAPVMGGVQATASPRTDAQQQSLSSSDSSLDGPPRPWAWVPVTSCAISASRTFDAAHREAEKRDGHCTLKGSDATFLASGEAQSKFHDLKEAYLRVLQTKGMQVPR